MMLAMHPVMTTPIDDMLLRNMLRAPMLATRTYVLDVPCPGVRTDDLAVTVDGGDTIHIHGETKATAHTHVVHWTTKLPDDADADQATAAHADGILTITMPRKAAAEPSRIEVSAEAPSPPSDDALENYTLTLSLPGIAASDLELVAEDGLLRVSGESKRTGARVDKRFHLRRDADVASAHASHVDGLLSVCVPKKSPAEAKSLAINEAADFQVV